MLTVTSRWRVVVSDLVAPRWPIRMFFEWKKLHVCETHFADVVGQRLSHLTISERTVLVFHLSSPRAEVDFVDRERLAKVFATRAILDPFSVTKFILRGIDDR